jgi:hypothetical protein
VSYVRSIPVRDSNGDELILYEFQDRRFLRKVRRLKLDSGEFVQAVGDAFIVPATGEHLVPIGGG